MRLWKDRLSWTELREKILDTPIKELDLSQLEKELSKYNKTAKSAEKGPSIA
jgi:hypothetical protein